MLKSNHKGFTLIELLVVVGIIGVLSAIVLSSVNSVRSKARDAKALEDVRQLTIALHMARDANGGTWPGISGWQCLKASGNCWRDIYTGNSTIGNALSPYMSAFPKTQDPNTGHYAYDSYLYHPNYNGGGVSPAGAYIIYALERPFADKCNGRYVGAMDAGYYYCYSWIGD
jgi:prepilin-type N-terminal cleavage/methylation domain-containing protein